jgi:hypothetical protein
MSTQLMDTLPARAPHASIAEGASTFDWLVGAWELDCDIYEPDGKRRLAGDWNFGWILDGRMMQDALYYFPEGKPEERVGGTSLRFYDTQKKEWNVVWFSPRRNFFVSLKGNREGARIVLHGQDIDGSLMRWSFNNIRPDSFRWLGEKSVDGGKTWSLEQEMHVRRRR